MFGRMVFLTFLIVPLIEIALFIVIGRAIGVVPTLLGVLLTAVIGSLLIRWQGVSLLRELQTKLSRGELPGRQVGDAMFIGLGGLLLLLPGYFTDFIGLLLLLPWTRELIYRQLAKRFRVVSAAATPFPSEPGRIDLDQSNWRER